MRNLFLFLFALTLSLSSFETSAQELTKKERKALEKEWKKKLKDVDPLEYKSMMEEQERLQNEAYDNSKKIAELESAMETKNEKIADLEQKVSTMQQQQKAEEEKKELMRQQGGMSAQNAKGLSYRVQIGAFRNKDLEKYTQNNPNFHADEAGGMQKYTIGSFADYWEADKFKVYLRAMGVKDAWVTAYKHGKRIPMKDAREMAAAK